MQTPNDTSAPANVGSDRLLSIQNVSEITGFCPVIASRLMKESGREIVLHRRKYILESSLLAYLREMEQR